jgi:VCBS repeat-containing protein
MGAGIVANNDTGVQITNNNFSYLSKGGIEMGGSSNVNISNNNFTDFESGAGIHPDAIQLYTAGTTQSAHDITITGNDIERGSGNAIQGIFVQDEVGDLPYDNLTISNNVVLGGMWDSLYVNGATGNVKITNNYVASWAGLDTEGSGTAAAALVAPTITAFAGYIWLQNLTGATLTETGNTAQAYLGDGGATLKTPAGNTLIGLVNASTETSPPITSVTAVAQKFGTSVYGQTSGNLLTGDSGTGLYLASVVTPTGSTALVSASGTTFAGKYGTLTVSSNGAFTYTSNSFSPTVGQTYDDQFMLTVGSSGEATSTTLNIVLTATGVGNGQADYITGGAAASTISGFGAGSILTSGVGADTFKFNSIAQSTTTAQTTINGFKAGDIIDLSAISTAFKIVSKFDGHADELVLAHLGTGNWQIEGDTTGAGTPNFIIHLLNTNVANLTAANLQLGAPPPPVVTTPAPLAAVAQSFSAAVYGQTSGNVLTGDTGAGLYVASVTASGDWSGKTISATGTSYATALGVLTISANGAFTYTSNSISPTVGASYDDKFTMVIGSSSGKTTTTTLDVILSSSGVGNGQTDYITGGAAASTISGFGAGSHLNSGVGLDTFKFDNIGQSTLTNQTVIVGFKAGDIIDLSAIDPTFKVVGQFDGKGHELMLDHMGTGNWEIVGETTGAVPNFEIHLLNATVSNLTTANFHL